MKALVTGATGFIGGALAAALIESGWQVRVLVRLSGRDRLDGAECYEIVEADLGEDSDRLRDAVADCDVVFHAAAIRNRWGTSPDMYRAVNVEGTQRLLEASIGQAGRFVYVSSVGVLGRPGTLGIDESFPLGVHAANLDYHRSKAEGEAAVLARGYEIPVVIVRPTITYGPGDRDGMITRLINLIARGRFIRVGRGRNHFHLTHIDDLTQGLLLAGTHPAAPGQTFILAGPVSIAVRDVIAIIDRVLGVTTPRLFVPEKVACIVGWGIERLYRVGQMLKIRWLSSEPLVTPSKVDILCAHRGFSSAKATRLLGYVPRVGCEEGLARTIEWMATTHRLSTPRR